MTLELSSWRDLIWYSSTRDILETSGHSQTWLSRSFSLKGLVGVNRLVWALGYHVKEVPGQSKGQCEWMEFGEFHIPSEKRRVFRFFVCWENQQDNIHDIENTLKTENHSRRCVSLGKKRQDQLQQANKEAFQKEGQGLISNHHYSFVSSFFSSNANIGYFSQGKWYKFFCHIANTKDSFFSVFTWINCIMLYLDYDMWSFYRPVNIFIMNILGLLKNYLIISPLSSALAICFY